MSRAGTFKALSALLLGVLFALLLFELGLRTYGAWWQNARAGDRGRDTGAELTILCVGNSHTHGFTVAPHLTYPAQLEALLAAKYSGARMRVVNAGRVNVNSSDILEDLPSLLLKYQPIAVAVMAGEPNWRKFDHYEKFRSGKPAWDLLGKLRLVQFVRLIRNQRALLGEATEGYSVAFPRVPLSEVSTVAMKWVGQLSLPNAFTILFSQPQRLAEAKGALSDWVKQPLGAGNRLALSQLARIHLGQGELDSGLEVMKTLQDVAEKENAFDYYLDKLLNDYEAPLRSSAQAAFRGLKEKNDAYRPSARLVAQLYDYLSDQKDPREGMKNYGPDFYRLVNQCAPGFIAAYGFEVARLIAEGQREEADKLIRKELRENPFAPDVNEPMLLIKMMSAGEQAKAIEEFNQQYPSIAIGPVGGHGKEIESWVAHDLEEMRALVEEAGAKIVFQTYPPYRGSLAERPPNAVIRAFARERKLPLADVSARFRELVASSGKGESSEEYFRKPEESFQDDHLNGDGNRVVASQLLEVLEGSGVLSQ